MIRCVKRSGILNILVIGNGFDLAHGLPTKYTDFLGFVKAFQHFKAGNDCGKYYDYFLSLKKNNYDLYEEIDNLSTDNCWLRYFIKKYETMSSEGKTGWIDFESEISTFIQALDSARKTLYEQFKKGNSSARMEYWQVAAIVPLFDENSSFISNDYLFKPSTIPLRKEKALLDLNKLTRCLEIYLCNYLNYDECKQLRDIVDLKIDKVLSFNYTDTYKRMYDKTDSSDVEYDYIHGKADIKHDIESCNLVLGIDEYLSVPSKNSDNEFIQFKKFYQRIYKMTGCRYIDWLEKAQQNRRLLPGVNFEHNLYFYGHSLDITDADIIRRMILEEGFKTTIFYHSNNTLGNQIANLVKVIGEEELIRRTDGSKRTIVFNKTSSESV